jgi:hypothetical protein
MLDILMIAAALGFFAACLAYQVGCQRLLRDERDQSSSSS